MKTRTKMKLQVALPLVGILALLGMAGVMGPRLVRAQLALRPPPLTTFEQNVATRCAVYFGPRPFTYYVFSANQLEELRSPEYLARVKDAHIGTVIVFKQLMRGSNQPSGVAPIDGHWEWNDPAYMADIITFLHGEGFKVVAYMSPHTWHAAKLAAVDLVDEVPHLGVDGPYYDGWAIGDRPEAAADVLGRMHVRGYVIWLHGSSGPYAANWTAKRNQSYLMPGGDKATHYLWGEIQAPPDDPEERVSWLKSRVALVDRAPGTLTYYKPFYGAPKPPGYMTELPSLLVAVQISRPLLAEAEADFFPEYRRLALEYHQNPGAFVRKIAREW